MWACRRSADARRGLRSCRRRRAPPRSRARARADAPSPRAARRSASVLRRAPRARRQSAAAVGRARVRGDEEGDVVMAVAELDLELDPLEERRRRMEDDAVGARLDRGELADAAVTVGHTVAR